MTSAERTAYLLLTGMAVFFGGTWVAGKVAVDEIPPFTLAAARFAIASVLVYAYARLARIEVRPPARRDLAVILALGVTAVAGYNVLFLTGLTLAPASDGAIVVPGLAPVFTVLLARLFLGERLGWRGALGLGIAIAGLVLVVGPAGSTSSDRLLGNLMFVLGAACWGVYSVISKGVTGRFDATNATLYSFAAGTLMLLPAMLVEGGAASLVAAPPAALAGVAYLAVFGSVLAFVFLQEGVRRIDVGRASSFALLVPVVGVVSSALLLGERLSPYTLAGGAAVIVGVRLIQHRHAPRAGVAEPLPEAARG